MSTAPRAEAEAPETAPLTTYAELADIITSLPLLIRERRRPDGHLVLDRVAAGERGWRGGCRDPRRRPAVARPPGRNPVSTDRPATTDQTTQVHGADTAMAHWPVVSLRHSGDWGVHCLACSIDAGDYVPRCLVSADEWPPLVLRGAQPADDAAVRASEPNRKCPLGLRHVNCSCAEPEQPWDEAGCSRSCRNGHTRRWGACAYGKEPAPTLHRFETGVAADGYVSGGHEPMTAEQVAEWLRVQGYAVAPRASEAPGDAHGPAPDVGAAQGGDDGSATESEPRGIVGPGYDAVWTYIRTHPGDAYRNAAIWRAVEAFRDAVIPAIRAQVADEITAHFAQERAQVADAEPVTLGGVHEQAKLLGRYDRVIATIDRIARGDQ